jgi:tetratricopeptide (TPR) repeat protein
VLLLAWSLGLRAPSHYWESVYQASTVWAVLVAAVLVALAAVACLSLAIAKSLNLRVRLIADLSLARRGAAEQDAADPGGEAGSASFQRLQRTHAVRDCLQAAALLCLALVPVGTYSILISTRMYAAFPSWDLVALVWGWATALGFVILSSLAFGLIRGLLALERIAELLPSVQQTPGSRRAPAYLYIAGVLCLLPLPFSAVSELLPSYVADDTLEAFLALLALGIALATLSALSFAAAKDRRLLAMIASQLESAQPQVGTDTAAHLAPPDKPILPEAIPAAPRRRGALRRVSGMAVGVLSLVATTLLCHREAMLRVAPIDASILAYGGRYEDALVAYDWAIRAEPRDANLLHGRGTCLMALGQYKEALASLDQAIRLNRGDPSLHYTKGTCLETLGRYAEALASYDHVGRLLPGEASDPYWEHHYARLQLMAAVGEARSLLELAKYADALVAYDRALSLIPASSQYWDYYYKDGKVLAEIGRGSVLVELHRYRDALAAYDEAARLKPKDAEAQYGRGLALSHLGRYAEAIEAYDRAIRLKPDYAEAHGNKGWMLANLGRHEDALAELERAIRLDPRDPIPYADMGRSLAALGRPREALAAYDRAVELDPDCVYARYSRARALGKMGRHKEALAEFSRITQLQPDDERAHFGKGYELAELGRNEEAIAAYDRAIELRPDDAYAHYNRACAYAVLGRTKQALSGLARAMELDGELRETARTEEDLSGLRSDPEFKRLVAKRR